MFQDIKRIDRCFIRDAECGRILGGSKLAFIACPASDEVRLELDIIKRILKEHDVESYIAVDAREYGRDIYCEKICSKIIESRFCICLLNETANADGVPIPNPNVYFEYGLMTALGKQIIPVQKDTHILAFNISPRDTIKYIQSKFTMEIENAIKAIMLPPTTDQKDKPSKLIPHNLNYFLAMEGLGFLQIQHGSDDEYMAMMGIDLGFILLFDFQKGFYGYVVNIKPEEDEQEIYLRLKALYKRITGLYKNIWRKLVGISQILNVNYDQLINPDQSRPIDMQMRIHSLLQLQSMVSDINVYVYSINFKNRAIFAPLEKLDEGSPAIQIITIDEHDVDQALLAN
jgi:hypothetical protein